MLNRETVRMAKNLPMRRFEQVVNEVFDENNGRENACDQCGTFYDWGKREPEILITRSIKWE